MSTGDNLFEFQWYWINGLCSSESTCYVPDSTSPHMLLSVSWCTLTCPNVLSLVNILRRLLKCTLTIWMTGMLLVHISLKSILTHPGALGIGCLIDFAQASCWPFRHVETFTSCLFSVSLMPTSATYSSYIQHMPYMNRYSKAVSIFDWELQEIIQSLKSSEMLIGLQKIIPGRPIPPPGVTQWVNINDRWTD